MHVVISVVASRSIRHIHIRAHGAAYDAGSPFAVVTVDSRVRRSIGKNVAHVASD